MKLTKQINIKYYRRDSQECDALHVILKRLMSEVFNGKPILLDVILWRNNWWRNILNFSRIAPILTINNKVYSQGSIPNIQDFIKQIGILLNDKEVIDASKQIHQKINSKKEKYSIKINEKKLDEYIEKAKKIPFEKNKLELSEDLLDNVLLCRKEKELGDSGNHILNARKISNAINEKFWNKKLGIYGNEDTLFAYTPLYGEICGKEQYPALLENLKKYYFSINGQNNLLLSTYCTCWHSSDRDYYWRGHVRFDLCGYMAYGLKLYGDEDNARLIRDSLLDLVINNGFYESYSSETGAGLGIENYASTADLFFDLAMSYKNKVF